MTNLEHLITDLPDPESARRFLKALREQHPSAAAKLEKNEGLLSDVLTLVAYSPLLSTTVLQNPDYIAWLGRERTRAGVRSKEELLESLARFALTHSQLDLHTQLARFRRRELLRIFLSDVRRLTTVAEITEDISNLADAILENALLNARQQMDNRFGKPQVVDDRGKTTTAGFCVVSLGKLGSRELNYSSDIDLLFLYSDEGETSGRGTRGTVTNREYFIKLGELVTKIVGEQVGEGAAYRVDMRLRPHGRVAPLAISVADAVRYYRTEARDWERQVLIRCRPSAGDGEVFRRFFDQVEDTVFVPANASSHSREGTELARTALESVRLSKQRIDTDQRTGRGVNVKLGSGGIREIEFIAQALQLAYGGGDRWLRASHTLISLARLADRQLISERELTELFSAYEFLRHTEHVLQMENGLQTHIVPEDDARRLLVARRMRCKTLKAFDRELAKHTTKVRRIFERVFAGSSHPEMRAARTDVEPGFSGGDLAEPSHAGSQTVAAASRTGPLEWGRSYYFEELDAAIRTEHDFRHRLGAFRQRWSELLNEIKASEVGKRIDMFTAKRAQTALAEASLDSALEIVRRELSRRYGTHIERLPLAVMGLGKLGGAGVDYGSDLDLVLVFDHGNVPVKDVTDAEFYSRAAEILVTTLSSMTRDGSVYRVDLRLRPYGKNGQSVISARAFIEYMRETADIWEWLAYVKLRAVAGDVELARTVENEIRRIIHSRAAIADPADLATETWRMRMRLEAEKARRRRTADVDIKYGPGGMLDVYFAMRYLQLRDDIPDASDDRSTTHMLRVLRDSGSLDAADHEAMSEGYRFLSRLDHYLRLTIGRTTRLPAANIKALDAVAHWIELASASELTEQLTVHRIGIRAAFERIVKDRGFEL